ncbi:MAG TPA: DUF309 domain-containing protein [Paludibaculum sp.]|jgi:hypothetical protein
MIPNHDPDLTPGVALFNAGDYFGAHERLEAEWLCAPRAERFFLQALIHMAVAWHHAADGNREGAIRQVDKGLRKLAGYLPERHGVDVAGLYADAQGWQAAWRAGLTVAERATIGLKR